MVTMQGVTTPLSAAVHVAGRGIPVELVSRKPKDVLCPAAILPFQRSFLTVRTPLRTLPRPSHGAVMVLAQGRLTRQDVVAVRGVTFTSTVRPVPQSLTLVMTTLSPLVGVGVGVGAAARLAQ